MKQGVVVGLHDTTLCFLMDHLNSVSTRMTQLGEQLETFVTKVSPPAAMAPSPPPPAPGKANLAKAPLPREAFIPTSIRYDVH